jgi:predicted MFS family arabinose efflux permease
LGQRRNIAFAALGGGQHVSYAVGLVLGGFFVENIGWRNGYHLGTVCSGIITAVAAWSLPADDNRMRGMCGSE